MGKSILLAGAVFSVALAACPAAAQQPPAPANNRTLEDRIKALEDQLMPKPEEGAPNRTLEDRVKALEDQLMQKAEEDTAYRTRLSTLEQQFADTVWTFDNSRPTVQSADGRFLLAMRYRVQFDT